MTDSSEALSTGLKRIPSDETAGEEVHCKPRNQGTEMLLSEIYMSTFVCIHIWKFRLDQSHLVSRLALLTRPNKNSEFCILLDDSPHWFRILNRPINPAMYARRYNLGWIIRYKYTFPVKSMLSITVFQPNDKHAKFSVRYPLPRESWGMNP